MKSKDTRTLRSEAQSLKPTVQIGKDGLTEQVAEELRRQVKAKGLVKVRLNPSYQVDAKKAAVELSEVSSSNVVDVRGRTVVLSRR
ncbi:MAG TPA: YhbY family RNA-binding protein [Thermoplasmata archaeon]|nr:YhbY family RNA-binding protein [Thermoplasmata archaeon]